ncbi:hypothetical protein FS749_015889 [Ceratobasidium sp. UAMH 11750]|nr:hypothetical protein FS749_015889 [Ceratobasidium sp. UAMH 11750]
MPLKPRQQTRNQKSTVNSSASNSNSSSKTQSAGQPQPTETSIPQYPDPNAYLPPTLASLRRDWRWAAVSQFLYTFQGPLRIDPYIEVELEDDLAYGTDVALSRIVHRLLFTLAQDRKITPQNWMGYLQGQYARRYSPRPTPFLQDMFPPAPQDEGTKSDTEDQQGEEPGMATSEAPEAHPTADPVTNLEPSNPPAVPLAPAVPDPGAKPAPDDSAPSEDKPPVDPVTPAAPEPVIKLPPMRQWSDLTQSEQLDVLWTLCEWQFQGAMRLRTLLGEEDSGVGWRMEPVGWDSKKNTYWLVGESRLWIQHHIPRPKLPPKRKSRTAHTVVVPLEPTISSCVPPSFDSDSEADREAPNSQPVEEIDSESELSDLEDSPPPPPPPPRSNGTSKRAKQNGTLESGTTKKRSAEENSPQSGNSRKRVRVVGTRISLRLRGTKDGERDEDEDWQSVPDEWKEKEEKQVLDAANDDPFGSDSDLTEVDELERELEEDRQRREQLEDAQRKRQNGRKKAQGAGKGGQGVGEKPEKVEVEEAAEQDEAATPDAEKRAQLPIRLHMAPLVDPMLPPPLPPGFVEWETVCATLQDWQAFPTRFEKATHPNEKAFRTFLNNVLVPAVTTSLRAQLKVKKLESAVQNRKRSSRIAIKESILEAQRKEEERRAEELELHARARRVEERERRAQEEAFRREREREEKIRLRETRAGKRNFWDGDTTESGSASPAPDVTPDPPVKIRLRPNRAAGTGATSSPAPSPVEPSSGSGTSSRTDDPWELLCEGCGKQGWNIDDGSQLVKCESCGRWSHTTCHDRADELAGNPKRNWSSVDFTCRACSNTARKPTTSGAPKINGTAELKSAGLAPPAYMYTSFQAAPNGHMPSQLPTYPNGMPQALYTMQTQPRVAQPPAFAPFVQRQVPSPVPSPVPIPIPQYQSPVPPVSQPPSYPYPYPNGYPRP